MRRLGLAVIVPVFALMPFGAVASAADLLSPAPVYTKAPVVAPVYNWSGFYVGGNAGYSWGHVDTDLSIEDGPFPNGHFVAPPFGFLDQAAILSAGSPGLDPKGFVGGGQLGYNWQVSHWVYGLEVDFDDYQLKATTNTATTMPQFTFFGNCPGTTCVANFSTSVSTDWLFTARPRLGYAWNQTLLYGTGGVAVTHVKFFQSYTDNVSPVVSEGNGIESASTSRTIVGWTAGAGVEQALTRNVTAKVEYLYTDFSGFSAFGVLHDSFPGDFSNFSNAIGHLNSSTVRAGVNYRF